jgi:hypothetical protein
MKLINKKISLQLLITVFIGVNAEPNKLVNENSFLKLKDHPVAMGLAAFMWGTCGLLSWKKARQLSEDEIWQKNELGKMTSARQAYEDAGKEYYQNNMKSLQDLYKNENDCAQKYVNKILDDQQKKIEEIRKRIIRYSIISGVSFGISVITGYLSIKNAFK